MTVSDHLATLRALQTAVEYLLAGGAGRRDEIARLLEDAPGAAKRVKAEIARLEKDNHWKQDTAAMRDRALAAEAEVARLNADVEEIEQLAAEKGIPFALDHIGLDGMANEVVALRRRLARLRDGVIALFRDAEHDHQRREMFMTLREHFGHGHNTGGVEGDWEAAVIALLGEDGATPCPQCGGRGTEDHSWDISEPCSGCKGTGLAEDGEWHTGRE